MTITISLDELRAHDTALRDHYRKFYITMVEMLSKHVGGIRGLAGDPHQRDGLSDIQKKIDDWEAKNPAPKLIPSV
jgi:hypothetical protein